MPKVLEIIEVINNKKSKKLLREYANQLDISSLTSVLRKAKEAYYNTENQLLQDDTYDILEDVLQSRDPSNKLLKEIGAPIPITSSLVKLPFHMGSMDKIKPNTPELKRWLSKYSPPYIISEKLDGISGLLTYNLNNTNLIKLYTRGNGKKGKDISHLIPFLKLPNLSKTQKEFVLRGEFIIKKSIFQKKYASSYPKALSLVAGLVGQKKPDKSILKEVDFIIFEIIIPEQIKPSRQFKLLNDLGFKTPNYKSIKSRLDSLSLTDTLLKMRKDSDYNIDGIIITKDDKYERNTSGNPKYSVAFKIQLDEEAKETIITKIEWNPSKGGILVPRIIFNPIILGGDTVQAATGNNAKYIVDHKLGIGSKIKVIKSGGVIPKIIEFIHSTGASLPDKRKIPWHWNSTKVDILLDNPQETIEVLKKELLYSITTLEIPFINIGLINKLIENGYNSLDKILSLTKDQLLELPGVKDTLAQKIINGIHSVIKKPIPLEVLMTVSQVFGNGFGIKKFKLLINGIPNILKKIQQNTLTKDQILKVEGYSDKTTNTLIKGLPKFKLFLEKHPYLKIASISTLKSRRNSSSSSKNSSFNNKTFVFTGFRNKELETEIQSKGGKVVTAISKNVDYVVVKNPEGKDGASSKLNKARELNIKIITLQEIKKI